MSISASMQIDNEGDTVHDMTTVSSQTQEEQEQYKDKEVEEEDEEIETVADLVKQHRTTKRNFSVFSLSAREDDSPLMRSIRISVIDTSTGKSFPFQFVICMYI